MPPNVRARSVVHPFFKSCSMQWNRSRSINPAWTGCIGTMSARIGMMLSARTMAGAHITEATPPTKMRLRVSIEPPNINVSEITLQLSEGKCPITTECLLFLSRKSSSWWLARSGYPGSGGELTKPRRDSTLAVLGRASAQPLGRKPQRLSPSCVGPSFGASSCR